MKSFRSVLLIALCFLLSGCGNQAEESHERRKLQEISPAAVTNDVDGAIDEVTGENFSGNPGYAQYYICGDDEWLYTVIYPETDDDKNALVRVRKDGTDLQSIYECEDSSLTHLNVDNGWLVFSLYQRIDNIEHYSICRMRTDGTQFEQFEKNVENLCLYKDRIYYSEFTKWGGNDIYSMDMDGKDVRKIAERDSGLEFQITGGKIYATYPVDDNDDWWKGNMELYRMDTDGSNKEKILEFSGSNWDICIWGDYVYYSNENDQLCKKEIGGTEEVVLVPEYNRYCIYGDQIYFTKDVTDDAGENAAEDDESDGEDDIEFVTDELYRISLDGEDLVSMEKREILSNAQYRGVFDGQIYYEGDETGNLIRINCSDGATEKLDLTIR